MVAQLLIYFYNRGMYIATLTLFVSLIIFLAIIILFIYLLYLLIKALKKYIKSEPARKERAERKKTLGEVIKKHRVDCKMTQEFVAETIGVSRQAVSKWENGITDPSTTNLIALASIFGVEADELLKETK